MIETDGDVLVIEDDQEINDLVGAYVELAGFNARVALNGEDAMREIDRHTPSLIVLDLMLPDVDGFEICRRLRLDPLTASVPVVILTALSRDDCRRQALDCGAVAFITKPFDPDKLMEAVRAHVCPSNNGREDPGCGGPSPAPQRKGL